MGGGGEEGGGRNVDIGRFTESLASCGSYSAVAIEDEFSYKQVCVCVCVCVCGFSVAVVALWPASKKFMGSQNKSWECTSCW